MLLDRRLREDAVGHSVTRDWTAVDWFGNSMHCSAHGRANLGFRSTFSFSPLIFLIFFFGLPRVANYKSRVGGLLGKHAGNRAI
jgi:hypothetical protein